jgi:hypothetical protein
MSATSSERLLAAAPVRHSLDDSAAALRPQGLNRRHQGLRVRSVVPAASRESVGRIITLGQSRFGALAPRAPNERKRRPLGAVSSVDEAQALLSGWRAGRNALVAFVAWLAGGGR